MGCCQSVNDDLIQKLKYTPFFVIDHDEDDDDLTALSKMFSVTEHAREESLWQAGSTNTTFHVIESGLVSLQFDIAGSKFFVTKKPGDCFGYHALNNDQDQPVPYTAVVKSDFGARLHTLTAGDLTRFWKSNKNSAQAWHAEPIIPLSTYIQEKVFPKLDAPRAAILATLFTWHKIFKDEILFEEGTPGNAFYIVARGCVAVEVAVNKLENVDKEDEAGQVTVLPGQNDDAEGEGSRSGSKDYDIHEIGIGGIGVQIKNPDAQENDEKKDETVTETKVVYEFKAGGYFGEVSLVINMPRTATIKAKENTTLLKLDKNSFDKYSPYDSTLREELEQTAHERIAQTLRRYKIPLLSAIPLNKFDLLSKLSKIQYYSAGEVVLRPGDSKSALYIIAHGKIGVYVTKQRRQSILATPTGEGNKSITVTGPDNPPTKGHQLNGIDETENKSNNNNNNNDNKQNNSNNTNNSGDNDEKKISNDKSDGGDSEERPRNGTIVIEMPVEKIQEDGKHHQTKSSTKTPIAQTLLAVTDRPTASQNENLVRLSFLAAKAQGETEAIKKIQANYNTLLSVYDQKNKNKLHQSSNLSAPGGASYHNKQVESKDSFMTDDSYSQEPQPQYVDNLDAAKEITIKAKSDPSGMSDDIRNQIATAMKSVKFGGSADLVAVADAPSVDTGDAEHVRHNSQPINGHHSSKNTQVSIASLLEKDEDVEKLRGKSSRRSSRIHNSRGSVPVFSADSIAEINSGNENNGNDNGLPDTTVITSNQSIDDAMASNTQKFKNELTPIHSENDENSATENDKDESTNIPKMPPPVGSDKKPKSFEKLASTSAMMDDNALPPRSSNNNNFEPVASQSGYDNDRPTPGTSPKSSSPAKEINTNNNSDTNDSNGNDTTKNQLSSHINNNDSNSNSRNSKNNNKLTTIEDRRARRARSKISQRNSNNLSPIDTSDGKSSKGSHLRDFQDADGTQYTEIEVSILHAGHYFGETSLMDEEELDDDEESVDFTQMTEVEKAKYLNERRMKKKDIISRNAHGKTNSPQQTPQASSNTPGDTTNLDGEGNTQNGQNALGSNAMKTMSSSTSEVGKRRSHKRRKSKKGLLDDDDISKRKKVRYKGSAPTFRCKTNCVVFSIDKSSFEEFFALVPEARPWFNIMLSRYNVEMDTVLLIPKATRYFTLFLESEYAEENIHFYLAVCDFKESFHKAERLDIEEMAQLIGQVFIAATAEQQVNIAGKERKQLLRRIKNKDISVDMFDESQKSIYTLLERDCFPRFKQSNFFQSFLTSVEEWNLNAEEEDTRLHENKLLEQRRGSAFAGISPKQSVRASAFTTKGQFLPSSLGRTMSNGSPSPLMNQDSENIFGTFDDRHRAKTTM